jgi:SAM-dependent methyltransferase
MNPGLADDHSSILYYDGDYPSPYTSRFPENFDATTELQGLAHDIDRFREIARDTGGPILELCCGTGRVAIPLARDGHGVTGVDISSGMLARCRENLAQEPAEVRARIGLVEQDITALALPRRDFRFAFCAFNSLLCIPSFAGQSRALEAVAAHLPPGALLALDLVNPLQLKIDGDPVAKPFFTRRNPVTGNLYTRFAMMDPFDAEHRQRLHGWYDEIEPDGRVRRTHYSLYWRPIFRYEAELMLERAGFRIEALEGGHQKEPYTAQSPKMFILARRM